MERPSITPPLGEIRSSQGENKQSSLVIAAETISEIAKNYSYNAAVQYLKLWEFMRDTGFGIKDILPALEKWPYDSEEFIRIHHVGNCINFAKLTQAELTQKGVHTLIIGKYPEPGEFTPTQEAFFVYRHFSLLYPDISIPDTFHLYMFEPGWRIPTAIDLTSGAITDTERLVFITHHSSDEGICQQLTNKNNNKSRQRRLDLHLLDQGGLELYNKRLLRFPRKLEIISPIREGQPIFRVFYNTNTHKFMSNIKGLPEFEANQITTQRNNWLSATFNRPDFKAELIDLDMFIKALPEGFWVR